MRVYWRRDSDSLALLIRASATSGVRGAEHLSRSDRSPAPHVAVVRHGTGFPVVPIGPKRDNVTAGDRYPPAVLWVSHPSRGEGVGGPISPPTPALPNTAVSQVAEPWPLPIDAGWASTGLPAPGVADAGRAALAAASHTGLGVRRCSTDGGWIRGCLHLALPGPRSPMTEGQPPSCQVATLLPVASLAQKLNVACRAAPAHDHWNDVVVLQPLS